MVYYTRYRPTAVELYRAVSYTLNFVLQSLSCWSLNRSNGLLPYFLTYFMISFSLSTDRPIDE